MPLSATASAREVESRRAKAFSLYVRLTGLGIDADRAAHMTDEEWSGAAEAASVRIPSPITRRIVVEMLAASERERSLCAFCGLGDPQGQPGDRKTAGHKGPCSK